MFYKTKISSFVHVSPELFEESLEESIRKQLLLSYSNRTREDFGFIISIMSIDKIGQGFKLPEDSSRHYPVEFTAICFKLNLHEVVEGYISSVTNFGFFVDMGIIEGLVHLSQSMADQVSFSKSNVIQGSKTGYSLKGGDFVRAGVIALSFKDLKDIKIGLTMRQPGLGSEEMLGGQK